ncbi:MAG: hypothetical protein ACRCVX_03525 [Shewanella sp.]
MAAYPVVATTKEQSVFEILNKFRTDLAAARLVTPAIPLGALACTQSIDLANGRTTFSVTLPITAIVGADGGQELDATAFLP